eukprot:TRINITY_DN121105_c0_g1_i1.p1 TRINITY_DN121105_c0_g1~~TRINITY_DN121105_c0_g1_i1.p1  ORF type:complete len:285 (+),score=36.80 TRINITY_DN121105_c0_g1_i1:40-855(+)
MKRIEAAVVLWAVTYEVVAAVALSSAKVTGAPHLGRQPVDHSINGRIDAMQKLQGFQNGAVLAQRRAIEELLRRASRVEDRHELLEMRTRTTYIGQPGLLIAGDEKNASRKLFIDTMPKLFKTMLYGFVPPIIVEELRAVSNSRMMRNMQSAMDDTLIGQFLQVTSMRRDIFTLFFLVASLIAFMYSITFIQLCVLLVYLSSLPDTLDREHNMLFEKGGQSLSKHDISLGVAFQKSIWRAAMLRRRDIPRKQKSIYNREDGWPTVGKASAR